MDSTLRALGELLVRAVPTFLLVLALSLYLKFLFFGPLEKTLQRRFDATDGARRRAAEAAAHAAARAAEYDAAVRAARAEAWQAQDQLHRQLDERRESEASAARVRALAAVEDAKKLLAAEAGAAKIQLARDAEALSKDIAASILGRSAA